MNNRKVKKQASINNILSMMLVLDQPVVDEGNDDDELVVVRIEKVFGKEDSVDKQNENICDETFLKELLIPLSEDYDVEVDIQKATLVYLVLG